MSTDTQSCWLPLSSLEQAVHSTAPQSSSGKMQICDQKKCITLFVQTFKHRLMKMLSLLAFNCILKNNTFKFLERK